MSVRADALAGVLAHAAAALPVQGLARRVASGAPARAAAAAATVLAVSALAVALARRVAAGGRGRGGTGDVTGGGTRDGTGRGAGGGARLAPAALGWFPVLGPVVAAAAELAAAAAWSAPSPSSRARAGHGRPDAGDRGARALLGALVLAAGRVLGHRAGAAVLGPDATGVAATNAAGTSPVPPVHLNVRPREDPAVPPAGFVVYLDGVGRAIERTTPVGRRFADAVSRRLPRWAVVLSVMPNDASQRPATARRVTGPLWRRLSRRGPGALVARGVWEGIVALDHRYRDRFVRAQSATLVAHLRAAGYVPGSGVPVVLVGLSAGAQTALHGASEVARSLGAPLDVVTFGAFADGSADLDGVRRVHAAVSWGDPAELAPVPFLPSTWTAVGVGPWSLARRERRVVLHRHDWATHVGRSGYLGDAPAADGRARFEVAADLVARAAGELVRATSPRPRAARP